MFPIYSYAGLKFCGKSYRILERFLKLMGIYKTSTINVSTAANSSRVSRLAVWCNPTTKRCQGWGHIQRRRWLWSTVNWPFWYRCRTFTEHSSAIPCADMVLTEISHHFECTSRTLLYLLSGKLPYTIYHIDGLVQNCSISSALAMAILQSCTKPSICSMHTVL